MILFFVLSVLGCPAPIVAVAAPCYVLLKRKTDRQGRAGLSGHGLFRDRDLRSYIRYCSCCFLSLSQMGTARDL